VPAGTSPSKGGDACEQGGSEHDKGHRQLSGIDMEERFLEPEPNVIASTEGFSVKVLGRTGMRYTEGTRSVRIDSEVLAKPRAIAMFKETIRFSAGQSPARLARKTETG
jgi:hypothetical protein